MKITSINNSYYNSKINNFKQVSNSQRQNVNFGIGNLGPSPSPSQSFPKWRRGLIEDYRQQNDLRALAEYFHDMDYDSIRRVCDEAYFFESTKWEKSQELFSEVKKIKKEKEETLDKITKLSKKEAIGESNIVIQKDHLKTDFINYLSLGDTDFENMNEYPIPNGILLYGPSKEKQEFVNWIKNAVPKDKTVVKTFTFNAQNPQESFKDLVDVVDANNELYYNTNKKRIVLLVDSLTPLLKPVGDDLFETQAKFKSFMEKCAKKYHTTIITSVDTNNLDGFESSAIGVQRFSKYKLKDGITSDERTTLKNLRDEIQRLNDKTRNATDKFKAIPWYSL